MDTSSSTRKRRNEINTNQNDDVHKEDILSARKTLYLDNSAVALKVPLIDVLPKNNANVIDVFLACGCGFVSAFCISPFLSVVDKCVTMAAAKKETQLMSTIGSKLGEFIVKPRQAFGAASFWMVCSVYTATYATANVCEVISEQTKMSPTVKSAGKLITTTGKKVNED